MNLKAKNNYLTVESLPEKNVTNITNFETYSPVQQWHKVLSVGEGSVIFNSKIVPLEVNVGDYVYVAAHGIVSVIQNLKACSIHDVLTVLEPDTMKFKPIGNKILVELIEEEDQGNLIIPENLKPKLKKARVVTLGTGWFTMDGSPIPFLVKEGDIVAFQKDSLMIAHPTIVGLENPTYYLSHNDIIGVVEE